jgi:hypothetical protein
MLDGDLAWAFTSEHLRFEWEESDRELLGPLIDATIMRVEEERLDELARPVVEALWDELRPLIADALVDGARRDEIVLEGLEDALADLELGPGGSKLASNVVQQAALDLADDVFFFEECLDCIEDGLGHAPPDRHPGLVARAAAALALRGAPDFGVGRPDDDERREARERVRSMAALGHISLPRLAGALEELVAEPLPPIGEDAVLQAVVQRRLASAAQLN